MTLRPKWDRGIIHADARDLSSVQPESIDIVWGMTPCYVPSIREIYTQVSTVLKPGGLYHTVLTNPALFLIEWDGGGYRIGKPYFETTHTRDDGAVEFRHYMDDIFNGLADNGLSLFRVEDRGRDKKPPPDAQPGSYSHEGAWIGGGFTIFAKKERP